MGFGTAGGACETCSSVRGAAAGGEAEATARRPRACPAPRSRAARPFVCLHRREGVRSVMPLARAETLPGPLRAALPRNAQRAIRETAAGASLALGFFPALFFKCLLKAAAGDSPAAAVWAQMCLGRRKEGEVTGDKCQRRSPALTLGSTIFHPLALSCWSSANFMLTSSMESCRRSQKPARSWKVGTGNALGSYGDRGAEHHPRPPAGPRLCCPRGHPTSTLLGQLFVQLSPTALQSPFSTG